MKELPKIASLLTSTIDHPNRISLNIYLPYCNFNCIGCHNRDIAEGRFSEVPPEKLLWELDNNFIIDIVIITGGEPTLHGVKLLNLIELIRKRRSDLPIRVDSNGSLPDVLELIADHVDGFAIDIKAPPFSKDKYERTIRAGFCPDDFIRSVKIAARLPYTIFRTVKYPWLTEEDLKEIREFVSVYGEGKPHLVNPYFEVIKERAEI
jgi:pyruvate formate lyase activating enzyme